MRLCAFIVLLKFVYAGLERFVIKAVHSIKGGNSIGFIKRRLIKDSVHEVINGSLVVHHRMTEMNHFRSIRTDDMDTQNFQCFGIKQKF